MLPQVLVAAAGLVGVGVVGVVGPVVVVMAVE